MFAKLTNDTWSGILHVQCNVQLALSLTSVVIDHVIIDLLSTDTARLLCRLRWPSTTLHGVPRAWRHASVTDPTHDVTYTLTPQCNKHTLQPSTLLEQLYCTTILREALLIYIWALPTLYNNATIKFSKGFSFISNTKCTLLFNPFLFSMNKETKQN